MCEKCGDDMEVGKIEFDPKIDIATWDRLKELDEQTPKPKTELARFRKRCPEISGYDWCNECRMVTSKCTCRDNVNHPKHYEIHDIETIDYLDGLKGIDWKAKSAIQYLSRYPHKGTPIEDLKKAKFYINRLITQLKAEREHV